MAIKIILYFLVLCSTSVSGFLAQDGSTGSISGPASADDRTILLNLIVNEQNSRIQLQNLVATLSMKLNEMNDRLVQKERFNAEVSIKLEKEKNNREHIEQMYAILEQRLNNCTELDGTGKADIHQTELSLNSLTNGFTALQTNLTDINNKLINLTHRFDIGTNELNAKFHNFTTFDKVLDGKVKTIGTNVMDINNKLINLTHRYEIGTNEFNAKFHNFTTFDKVLDGKVKTIQTKAENISLVVEETNERLENISSEIVVMKGGLSPRKHEAVGFSVYSPDKSSGSGRTSLKYQRLIYNTGNGYSMTSGVFTCLHPGLYFFTATFYRSPGIMIGFCYFYVNSKSYNSVTSGYGAQTAGLSGSQSMVIKLKAGDRVYLSGCAGIDHFYAFSSFSGFMISS